jgi:cytidylate kinase
MSLITITRSMGCGGAKIASLVANELKLELYDDQRLQQKAIKMGIRSEELESLDEKAPGFFDHLRGYKPELYLDLMESVVYEVAQSGKGVILGHGSQLLLRDFGCALHVRIYASEKSRIQRLMTESGVSEKTAEKLIHKSDHERRGFLRFAFHMEWNDLSLYDLVINTEKMGTDGAARLIIEAGQLDKIQECGPTALGAMERLSLTKKIEAALLKNNFSPIYYHIEVPKKGLAQIRGFTYSEEEKRRLLKVVKQVSGVSNVEAEVAILQQDV